MRRRITFICLNRLGQKKGTITLSTDSEEIDTKEVFEANKAVIKKLYPDVVKLKFKSK